MKRPIIFLLYMTIAICMFSCSGTDKKNKFVGYWTIEGTENPPPKSPRDRTSIPYLSITKNGDYFVVSYTNGDKGGESKQFAEVDGSNNLSLFGGEWILTIDPHNNDNLFVAGKIFRRKQ